MITLQQIKLAHAKVKSGADFPAYISDLIKLGVKSYETRVDNGSTIFSTKYSVPLVSEGIQPSRGVSSHVDRQRFISELKAHQQGRSGYPEFLSIAANTGISKWIVDMNSMTCTYFDFLGNEILVEEIPKFSVQ